MKQVLVAGGLLVALVTVGCSGPPAPARSVAGVSLPAGWRWESFGPVEIGVPGDWGYGTSGRPWCQQGAEGPFVGRPGAVSELGCAARGRTVGDPATLVDPGGTFVWFTWFRPDADEPGAASELDAGATPGTVTYPRRIGDRDTLVVAGIEVAVQAPVDLGRRIRATLRVVDRDHNDCPVTSPFAANLAWRPAGPAVSSLTGVTAVSACSYSGGGLVSSTRLDGTAAVAAVRAVASAPAGGGPDSPVGNCASNAPVPGDLVLRIRSAAGDSQVVPRYGGCLHRGLDDGTTVRTLTRAAVAPFVTGPNLVTGFTGVELAPILWEPRSAAAPGK